MDINGVTNQLIRYKMNRSEAKDLLPIIQGYVDGKKIEKRPKGRYDVEWQETVLPAFNPHTCDYRIKPEPKYRPFKDAEECWQEMQKHEPFGWVKDKERGHKVTITRVNDDENTGFMAINGKSEWTLEGLMDYYTFADGTPFGIKEE